MAHSYRKDRYYQRWCEDSCNFTEGDFGSYYESNYLSQDVDLTVALEPLVKQFQIYDDLRLTLERHGGNIADLKSIAEILTEELTITGRYRTSTVSLADQKSLHFMLRLIGDASLYLNVRRIDTGMPVYYLCRIYRDYWSNYGIIIEDIYMSPGFPLNDERFVKLMARGHEVYYLRLSPFRNQVMAMVTAKKSDQQKPAVDETLYKLGRYVFQAAWHEDQQVGIGAAKSFDLPQFRDAIELLYLCLSGELCEIRSKIDEQMFQFFDEIYPQQAIKNFLNMLTRLDGEALIHLPQKALKLYIRLSRAFSKFLRLEITWGNRHLNIPLFKLIFGNFRRLDLLSKKVKGDLKAKDAAAHLESVASNIISELLSA